MELLNILNILKRWIWLIVLIISLTIIIQIYLSSQSGVQFEATSKIQVLTPDREDVSVTDTYLFTSDRDEITVAINNFLKIANNQEVQEMTNLDLNNNEALDVSVRAELGADLVYVTAKADSPELAALIANTYSKNAISYYGKIRSQASEQAFSHFTTQLELAQEDLNAASEKLKTFQSANGITTPSDDISIIQASLQRLNEAKDNLQIDKILQGPADGNLGESELAQLGLLEIDLQAVYLEILKLENELQEINNSNEPDSIRINELNEEIKLYQLRLDYLEEQKTSVLNSFQEEDSSTSSSEVEIDRLISIQKIKLAEVSALEFEYNNLVEDINREQENVNFLAEKANQASLMQAFAKQATFLQIIESAEPSTGPASNNLIIYVLGIVGSLGLSLLTVFVLDYLTQGRSIKAVIKPEPEPDLALSHSEPS